MSEVFDIQQQWFDTFGGLLVGGKVYYGKPNTDPTLPINQIAVFSDRVFTVATQLPNPQTIGADGRVENKPWLNQRYSLIVEDKDSVQVYESADNGENPSTGQILSLSNVDGINDITAESPAGITEYQDQQIFTLEIFAANTGDVTLNIDGIGASPIMFNFNEQIAPGFFQTKQTITFIYNLTEDSFFWIDSGRGISLLTNVAGDGNTITADGGPSTAGYVNQQLYSFKPTITNTDAVTLKVGDLPTVSIKDHGNEIAPGELIANLNTVLSFNSTGPVFELLNNLTKSILAFTVFNLGGASTWNKNDRTKSVLFLCTGGGGGGGGNPGVIAGAGGGAGGTSISFIFSPATSYSISVGSGGPANANTAGSDGGDSNIGSTVVIANGGSGGGATGIGGNGGLAGTGDIAIVGGDGGVVLPNSAGVGSPGGGSFYGGGGKGGSSISNPNPGGAFGSGGGGSESGGTIGAAGKEGIIYAIEFS